MFRDRRGIYFCQKMYQRIFDCCVVKMNFPTNLLVFSRTLIYFYTVSVSLSREVWHKSWHGVWHETIWDSGTTIFQLHKILIKNFCIYAKYICEYCNCRVRLMNFHKDIGEFVQYNSIHLRGKYNLL